MKGEERTLAQGYLFENIMTKTYFAKLHEQTDTRMWVNNPSVEECKLAIAQGAPFCSTNPAFLSKLIKTDPTYVNTVIDGVLMEYAASGQHEFDYDKMALVVSQRATKPIMDLFMPIYEATGGKEGYVTIQDDPRFDQNAEHTIAYMLENAKLFPNFIAKIPVIDGGIQAIEACVQNNIVICATEVFAVSQALTICERYEAACKKYNARPPMFLTHISGIFDEYLGKIAKREGIQIDPEVLKEAGVSIARKQYKVLAERGYKATLLGGGARDLHHFTELIGGPHITINWSTAEELIQKDFAIEETINKAPNEKAIAELSEKFEIFRLCYSEDAIPIEAYADMGPVQLFRNAFLNGWYVLLAQIAARRNALAL